MKKSIKNVYIKLKLENVVRSTEHRGANDLEFNDKLEFPLTSMNKELIIQIYNNDFIVGESVIPLNQIGTQEEIQPELEIADEKNPNNILWRFNPKLTLIWSYYKLYQDLYSQTEKEKNNTVNKIEKINSTLEHLTDPFKLVFEGRIHKAETEKYSIGPNDEYQLKVADQVENALKSTFSKINYNLHRFIHHCLDYDH